MIKRKPVALNVSRIRLLPNGDLMYQIQPYPEGTPARWDPYFEFCIDGDNDSEENVLIDLCCPGKEDDCLQYEEAEKRANMNVIYSLHLHLSNFFYFQYIFYFLKFF